MSSIYHLPDAKAIGTIFSSLLDLDVDVFGSAVWAPAATDPCLITVYTTDDKKPAVIVALDIELGSGLAARLTRVPVTTAKESISAKKLTPDLFNNLQEVMNVLGCLVNSNTTPHLILNSFIAAPPAIPDDIYKFITAPVARLDVKADVTNYTCGKMSFYVLQ